MNIIDCEQDSPEWHAARCGKVTASRIADIVRKTKTGISASRNTYMGQLVAERLSGQVTEGFTSKAMEWGKETEDKAIAFYAFMRDSAALKIGFVIHPSIDMSGASPDRLIDDDGLIEVKCPNSATHIATLLGAPVDPDYVKQMQWQMACTGRKWCDFVSFDPRMPSDMCIHQRRVHRDPVFIAELEHSVSVFLAEVDATVAQLLATYRISVAA